MKLAHPILVLLLLTGVVVAQIAPDRDRFDIEIHPGDVEERTLTLTNTGDRPIYEIKGTEIGGSAGEFIFLDIPDDPLNPGDEMEVKVFFVTPPEIEPGTYTGFMYLMDDVPPSMPERIEFFVDVVDRESYDLSLSIDDAKRASTYAKAEQPAFFDLGVTNLGQFRDVASIDARGVPEDWSVSLIDGKEEVALPYNLPIAPGDSHTMKLQVETANPGNKGSIEIVGTSLGNQSKNDSVRGDVKFGMAVRGYKVDIKMPEKMAVNRTYSGTFAMSLDVSEEVLVSASAPDDLMVIPGRQVMAISPDEPGRSNFTLLAAKTGVYPLVFELMDSNGIPMPEEMALVAVIEPAGTAILTNEDLMYKSVASLIEIDNESPAVFSVPEGDLSQKDREGLYAFSKVIVFGSEDVVSSGAEEALGRDADVQRIGGEGICDASWRLISRAYENGTNEVVLSGTDNVQIFRGYQKARDLRLPMAICSGEMSNTTISIIEEMKNKETPLSKILVMDDVGEGVRDALEGLGIEVEGA